MAEIALEMTPAEVKSALDRGATIRLIDVREPEEHAICHIEGAELIPMRTIPEHLQDLDDDGPPGAIICVYCHHGVRSLSVVDWLRRQDVLNCTSIAGGIDRWSVEIDPTVRRY
jgi:adenylyltransferase/sulfurtransferase